LESTVDLAPLVASHLVINSMDGALERRAKSSAVKRVAGIVTQEYVTRVAMQAAEVTSMLAIFGRSHDKAEIGRITLNPLSSLVGRKVDLLAS
jgi:hypothetical protein